MELDRRILGVARSHRLTVAGAVALGALGGVVTVAQAWLLARVVAAVFLGGADRGEVAPSLAWLLVAITLRAGLSWGADAAAARAATGVKHDLRCRVVDRLFERGPVAIRSERSGELVTLLGDGVEALDAYVGAYLPQLALAAVIPLTVAAAVLSRDLLSGVVLVLTAPLIPLFMVLIGRAADARARRQWLDLARMSAFFFDTIQGLTTHKVLGRACRQLEVVGAVGEAFRSSSMAVLRIAFLSALTLELVATLSVAVVAVEIGLRLLGGGMDFAAAFFVLLLAPEFYLPMRRLGAAFHAGTAGLAAASRLFELAAEDSSTGPHPEGRRPMPAHPAIALEEVSFAYPAAGPEGGAPRPALERVSLRLAPGETVAVVGPSGAGKSTLALLVLRLLEPDGGRLTADGVDAAEIALASWRRAVSWIPQHPTLFAGSVAANLRLARPEAGEAALEAALAGARFGDLAEQLPGGLASSVGERGATLSGGQARRIALARALLADAPVLVLDEPAGDLDPRLQEELDASLATVLAGRSALVIAHRLPTALAADRIVVLDRGRVVGEGSHRDLLAGCTIYRSLVESYGGAQ